MAYEGRSEQPPDDGPVGSGGEDEVVVQVFEEEIVVTKRVVLKEEIRLRKSVAWDEETVEVDLRQEEVEIRGQDKARGRRRCLLEAPRSGTPAREGD